MALVAKRNKLNVDRVNHPDRPVDFTGAGLAIDVDEVVDDRRGRDKADTNAAFYVHALRPVGLHHLKDAPVARLVDAQGWRELIAFGQLVAIIEIGEDYSLVVFAPSEFPMGELAEFFSVTASIDA